MNIIYAVCFSLIHARCSTYRILLDLVFYLYLEKSTSYEAFLQPPVI
jgi:hypothetical protein